MVIPPYHAADITLITSAVPMGDFLCVLAPYPWVFFGEVSGPNTWPI